MATRDFTTYRLYRWRYIIGYSLIGLLLAGLLLFAGLAVPGGLTQDEIDSTVVSEAITPGVPESFAIPHLPYHLLQAASFSLFGITELSIKLPSLLLGLASAIGLIFLLRRWFRPNIAIMASLIAVATGQFLFISQLGSPGIMYVFWPIMLLLLGTQITRVNTLPWVWKILFAVTVALSLYSPLSIYILIAIGFTIALHPHLRTAVRKLPRMRVVVAAAAFAVLVAPLVWLMTLNPPLWRILVGLPDAWPNIIENIGQLASQYVLLWEPVAGTVMTPIFGLGTLLLIGIGIIRLFQTRATTRSYLIMSWLVLLTPVILISPDFVNVMFVPVVMLLAMGLTSLITYWYRLFPFNPYARVAGLIPLIVLVGALMISGIDRYFYGYYYSPSIVRSFNKDLQLLPADTTVLKVSQDERAFFSAVAKYRDDLTVTTETPASTSFVTTREARINNKDYAITAITTNRYSRDADRYYTYQRIDE